MLFIFFISLGLPAISSLKTRLVALQLLQSILIEGNEDSHTSAQCSEASTFIILYI